MATVKCIRGPIYLADGSPLGAGDTDSADMSVQANIDLLAAGYIVVVDPLAPPPVPPAKHVAVSARVPFGGSSEFTIDVSGANPGDVIGADGLPRSAGSGGSGVPAGGTTGQVLKKNSGVDGDAGWSDSAALSNTAPLPAGTAAAGTATDAARSDHVHPLPGYGLVQTCPIGFYLRTPGVLGKIMSTLAEATLYATPLFVPGLMTVDRFALSVSTAGAAGALIRVGFYAHDPSFGGPGARILDAGTIDPTTTGDKSLTISQQLSGTVWVAFAVQGGATTRPAIRATDSVGFSPFNASGDLQFTPGGALSMSGSVAGALPASWTQAGTGVLNAIPLIAVRRSA